MSSAGTSSSFGISLDHNSNSNATPSPTEPLPLPHLANLNAPPNNQAFAEAVASLSHAADILSNAAKAISSAVESLMLAGAHSDCADFFMQTGRPCSPENRTKDWLTRNYSLNPSQVPNTKLPSSSLLFENAVVAAQQGGVGDANANGLRHASPRAHESDPKSSSLDDRSDISQLDLTERDPALLLNQNREPPSVDQATPLAPGNAPQKGDQPSDHESIQSDPIVHSPQSQASSLDSSGGHITEPEAQPVKPPIQLNPNTNNLNTTSSIGFGLGSSSHVPSWNQLNHHQDESRFVPLTAWTLRRQGLTWDTQVIRLDGSRTTPATSMELLPTTYYFGGGF
ncbi:hypothetical protein FRC08_016692 [Ceratobasidium sp. 394]|nr:hypothetical protein FRC08_016692 [Ceratobasidium sp. 394]